MKEPTDDEMATANERARELADALYGVLDKICDRETAYLSAMQILLARSGLSARSRSSTRCPCFSGIIFAATSRSG